MKRLLSGIAVGSTVWISILLSGCRANVDLNNIDTSTELKMGLAVPIGSLSATVGDFLGTNNGNIYIDTLDHFGVLTFKDTFRIERNYHQLDLKQYISETDLTMGIHDNLQEQGLLIGGNKVIGTGQTICLKFPLILGLNGINNEDGLSDERIDSAFITDASFISTIQKQNFSDLQWSWIDSVNIVLGKAFRRPRGNVMRVYSKGDGYGFGNQIPIDVDNFSLNLMKRPLNPKTEPDKYWINVIDTCDFEVRFYMTIPENQEVTIADDAAFRYKLGVQFIDYTAVWGMFKPSAEMSDEDTLSIAEVWNGWNSFQDAKLPFSSPRIDVNVITTIAGALRVNGDYLFAKEMSTGKEVHAKFSGRDSKLFTWPESDYLPISSNTIGDSVILRDFFSEAPDRGELDKLFTIRPDMVGYKFSVEFDRTLTPQIRILPQTGIRIEAICSLPMMFGEGVEIHYADTLKNVNLSKITLDSLLASSDVLDTINASDVKLFVKIDNTIPLQIKGVLRCLDEDGQVVMDPTDPKKPLLLTQTDTISIATPKFVFANNSWNISKEGEALEVISINKERFDTFSKIKNIYFEVIVDNESLQEAYDAGKNFQAKITDDSRIKVQLGLATKIDAVLNFDHLLDSISNSKK